MRPVERVRRTWTTRPSTTSGMAGDAPDAAIGHTGTTSIDTIHAGQANLLANTLDRDETFAVGDVLPVPWHWAYFLSATRPGGLTPDGHTARGGFLPDIPLPRRMWAGGQIDVLAPLRVGAEATRTSTIGGIVEKDGRSGRLVFVTVDHEITQNGVTAIRERQDLVFREAAAPGAAQPTPEVATDEVTFERSVEPDPILLFRYSALTFNGHRIHYDVDYCRDVEGYPGLVVHGPLIATLLLDGIRDAVDDPVASFRYRAQSPLFAGTPFHVRGRRDGDTVHVAAEGPGRAVAMRGQATLG